MSILTPLDLQNYITARGIIARLIAGIGETPTVPAAALALGVTSDQIIKTLLFLIEKPAEPALAVVVISHGEKRVDKHRLAEYWAVGKKRVHLAPASVVQELLGYPAGGVPPFAHRTVLPVMLDKAVFALESQHDGRIYGGGGDQQTMMELTVAELVRTTNPQILAL